MNNHFNKKLSIILASTFDGGIGYNNTIPWYISEELKKFKKITTNVLNSNNKNAVIMGFNTWLSLGEKPLKNRINIILSKSHKNNYSYLLPNVYFVYNLNEALDICNNDTIENIFIIGGAILYNDIINNYFNLINKIYLSIIFYNKNIITNKYIDINKIFSNFIIFKDNNYIIENKKKLFASYICIPKYINF